MPKPRILVLIDWYLPGYLAGGPIQSIRNLISVMNDHYDFSIITRNKDHTAHEPYPGVESDSWTLAPDGSRCWYFSDRGLNYAKLRELIAAESPDFVYLNSMFSIPFTFWPWWMLFRGHVTSKVVLAPRGMLQNGALKFKRIKKRIFLGLLKIIGSHKKIIWHPTDEREYRDVELFFGKDLDIRLAPNIPKQEQRPWKSTEKLKGYARFVFSSRISEKKNLDFFLHRLKVCKGQVSFDIYGTVEDAAYVEKCQKIIAQLPASVSARFCDPVPNAYLGELLEKYHFAVLTTYGENFGHAIFEGLLAGKPVIISNRTPWKALSKLHAGWDLPLEKPEQFEEIIQQCIDMDQASYDLWSKSSWKYAKGFKDSPDLIIKIKTVFS